MISRVAESCFWLTRYLERVDTWSRLLDVTASFSLDVEMLETGRWAPLVVVVGQRADFVERYGSAALEDGDVVQEYLVWSPEHPSSLHSSLLAARENARTIREVISLETWEAVNEFWIWFGSRATRRQFEVEPGAFYQKLSSQCMTIHGICYSTMLHEDPFTFMKLGRALERVGQTARIVDVSHHALLDARREDESPAAAAQWIAILRSCSAYEPFFKRANNVLSGPAVADFLIFDRTFPRSVLHNLDRARGLLMRLYDADPAAGHLSESWGKLERFRGTLLQMSIQEIHEMGLHETLTWIVDESARLCESIRRDYFDISVDAQRRRVRLAKSSQSQSQTSAARS